MAQTYTPRHVGRESVSERPGYGWYLPRHRRIVVTETPVSAPSWR